MTDRTNEFESHPHGDPHDVGGVRPEDVPEGPVVDTADADGQGGYGPVDDHPFSQRPYHHPAAGWGAAMAVTKVLLRTREPIEGTWAMFTMNKPGKGFDCPGCAWPDDPGVAMDICENGIKHVTWEMTHKRTTPEFLAEHTVTELREWTDFQLEDEGRLTHPMRYDAASDRYVPISWEDAFALIGEHLRKITPDQATFTPRDASATRPPSSTSCSRANTAPTTCPTARTCATRRPAVRCRPRSARARARAISRTGRRPTS